VTRPSVNVEPTEDDSEMERLAEAGVKTGVLSLMSRTWIDSCRIHTYHTIITTAMILVGAVVVVINETLCHTIEISK